MLMPSYQDTTATVEQKREYAECVGLLYPHQLTGSAILALKFWIICALVSIPVGVWLGWEDDRTAGAIMGGILAPVFIGLVGLCVMLAVAGISFLVNA
jgi:ABC-type spermidine/putrescine transport system permease subunit I